MGDKKYILHYMKIEETCKQHLRFSSQTPLPFPQHKLVKEKHKACFCSSIFMPSHSGHHHHHPYGSNIQEKTANRSKRPHQPFNLASSSSLHHHSHSSSCCRHSSFHCLLSDPPKGTHHQHHKCSS